MALEVNGREYRPPRGPTAIVCLDGSDPAYLDDALLHAHVPTLARWKRQGTWTLARAAIPSFTNPNNVSIVTGAPPSIHGISGNHFFDRGRGLDVPMTDRAYLTAPTILDELARHGVRVVSITAKEKLRALVAPLAHGMNGAAFSVENPGELGPSLVERAPPGVYSPDASLYVLDAGIRALERGLADFAYLSTTDYIQHKHAPGKPEARAFYAAIDLRLAQLERLGAVVGLTADHGMNDKTRDDGSPNVTYLGPILDAAVGRGTRVTLPITDPYVVHHGALGSCAMVYVSDRDIRRAQSAIAAAEGVDLVLTREEASHRFELPADRIGDLVVLASRNAVLGKSASEHDLSHVERGLRSHGGLHEQVVPLISNETLRSPRADDTAPDRVISSLRNFDVFDLVLNR